MTSHLQRRQRRIRRRLKIDNPNDHLSPKLVVLQLGKIKSPLSPVQLSPRLTSSLFSLMPPRDAVVEAVNSYFQYCHKQPLWLFDRDEFSSLQDCREETLFSLLALSAGHTRHPYFRSQTDELSERYAQAAREHIMQRIAEGTATLSTIQSLCMLAMANLQANNLILVSLHVGIASTLAKCASLDFETYPPEDVSLHAESRRRVFWSLQLLQQMYGQQGSSTTDILEHISRPRHVMTDTDLSKKLNDLPPSMPQGVTNEGRSEIWAYMVQLTALWADIRTYVRQFVRQTNFMPPPWSVESRYTIINARLMELETKLPSHHRFDLARFSYQENQQLQNNREYWSPWIYLQFTYHTIHNLLNHPFLYSSRTRQSPELASPNTFWKTSLELAFIHSTWVARLIEMVTKKTYRVSDPFIGHCTAIAATVHIYFCRADDKTTREAALDKLAKCIEFLAELALLWPSCRVMHEKLQALFNSALWSARQSVGEESDGTPASRTLSINTRLMWDILLYNVADSRGTMTLRPMGRLFDESASFPRDQGDEGEDTVEMEVSHHPTVEVILSNGQALPLQSGQRQHNPGGDGIRLDDGQNLQRNQRLAVPAADPHFTETAGPSLCPMLESPSASDMTYDLLFQFQDPGSPFFGAWEAGNL